MSCHWWNRWYHRRLRKADLEILLPALRLNAERRATQYYVRYSEGWEREVSRLTSDMFNFHCSLPNEKHWRCDCAISDGVQI